MAKISTEDQKSLGSLKLSNSIYRVWGTIGYDIGENVDNEEAIESCIDADRLLLIAEDKESNDLVSEMVKKYGYMPILKYLSKKNQLT